MAILSRFQDFFYSLNDTHKARGHCPLQTETGLSPVALIVLCTPGMGVNLWGDLLFPNGEARSPLYENQGVFIKDGYYQKYELKARAGGRPTI